MLYPKTNVCKLRNGVLLSVFACFQDGHQYYTESYIVVDSLFNVFVGVLCWSLFYYASLCVLSIYVTTLTKR